MRNKDKSIRIQLPIPQLQATLKTRPKSKIKKNTLERHPNHKIKPNRKHPHTQTNRPKKAHKPKNLLYNQQSRLRNRHN